MGKRRRENKEADEEERMRVKVLIDEVFNHFNTSELYKEDFVKYFQKKGMSENEIDMLWVRAMNLGIMVIEVEPIWEPGNPLNILGQKIVFRLVGIED